MCPVTGYQGEEINVFSSNFLKNLVKLPEYSLKQLYNIQKKRIKLWDNKKASV